MSHLGRWHRFSLSGLSPQESTVKLCFLCHEWSRRLRQTRPAATPKASRAYGPTGGVVSAAPHEFTYCTHRVVPEASN